MRKTLEDFYYGNIAPSERQMTPNSELKRAAERVVRYESQLTEQLDEPKRMLLEKLVRSQHEIDIYNVTMRNYDIMSAGRNVSGKSVGAVLAIGQGSQSYDNFLYPKTVNYDIPEETWDDSESVSIPVDIAKVKGGEYIWLGTYTLAEGDRVFYDVSAESGKQLDVGFAKPGQERPNPTYNTISNLRQENEKLEVKSGAIVWGVKSGKYSLFIHTEGGTLTGVTGYVTIIKANAD